MSWLISQALMQDFANSHSSLEPVAESLAATYSDGELSAPLSVIPTPHKFWRNDKTMEPCQLSRFGLMCAVLTEGHGEELLMWYLADSHAKTLALPEKAQGLMENDQDYGQSSPASLAKYDRATHSLKTAQLSLIEDLTGCCVTLPRSGSMRNGIVFRRAHSVPRMSATEFGLSEETFPTPTVCGNYNRKGLSKTSGDGLATYVKKWPTPQASDNRDRGNLSTPAIARRIQKGKQVMLSMCVSSENGRLNPRWVEWLMGWPIGWTDLKPLETARFHEWRQQHSASYQIAEKERKDENRS